MIEQYIDLANKQWNNHQVITFPEDMYEEISIQEALDILDKIDQNALMLLPLREIKFFTWLKENAPEIWDDLWNDENYAEYVVSISFLPMLIYNTNFNGFPICDLLEHDNYFFTRQMMDTEQGRTMIETSQTIFENHQPLALHQILALEIDFNAIDIWHFAYKYNITLDKAFEAAEILFNDKALKHIKRAEDVVPYLEFI
ncbi:MAG TPA: hypothetical protein PLC04_09075 [Candidatus Kapabacteria bacterium]|jgi:hypothetical protein|nr:hypothetical protein [Candidatus Kapabacteria bacterium]HOV93210.1 hypothetical protein [Candidatus Kapabacteria bacterium]